MADLKRRGGNTAEAPVLCSIADTARITGLSQFFIRNGIRAGTIPFIRSGTKFLVHLPRFLAQLEAAAETASRAI